MPSVTSPSGRISRTGQQLGVGGAVSIVLNWLTGLFNWDLDPGPGNELPGEVMVALMLIVSMAMSWWMNRKPANPGAEAAKEAAGR